LHLRPGSRAHRRFSDPAVWNAAAIHREASPYAIASGPSACFFASNAGSVRQEIRSTAGAACAIARDICQRKNLLRRAFSPIGGHVRGDLDRPVSKN
jgi:predicted transcriptional regulator